MEIRVKKRTGKGIHRIEGDAEIKELFSNVDLMDPGKISVQICFKGNHCSGIIELTREEARSISKNVARIAKLGKKIKVIKLKD